MFRTFVLPAGRIMTTIKLCKLFSRSPKVPSTDEQRQYRAAENEFTYEGAPPVKPGTA